jgi:hypothetical protein
MHRTKSITKRRLLNQAAVDARLGQQVRRDAETRGWLSPCAVKRGQRRERGTVFYSEADVAELEERILSGDYPQIFA